VAGDGRGWVHDVAGARRGRAAVEQSDGRQANAGTGPQRPAGHVVAGGGRMRGCRAELRRGVAGGGGH